MKRSMQQLALTAVLGLVWPGAALAAEKDTVEEVLSILRSEGIIDEAEEQKLLVKHQVEQEKRSAPPVAAALTEGWEWTGDLRLRQETFWYNDDETGFERDNRYRFRYRARIGFKKKINDWMKVGMRLASGSDDLRSTNQTLGNGGVDFDPDPLFIDRAFVEIKTPELAGTKTKITAGKISNPFLWKNGKDLLIWDGDVNLEGVALKSHFPVGEGNDLWFATGAFIAEERSTNADPKVFGFQLGGKAALSDAVTAGARTSLYEWRSLSPRFIMTAAGNGNLLSAFDTKARIGEASAFAKLGFDDNWPVLVYGNFVRNFSADSTLVLGVPAGDEDTAMGVGIEIGSSSKYVKLGFGYFMAEANSTVATFMDSDLFDGVTNRKGFIVYGSKKIFPNTELKLTIFDSKEIEDAPIFGPAFGFDSVSNSDRRRMQADVIFKF